MFGETGLTLDTVAHIIQVALTPVFLLSGIATLLNVFATRLARVADKVDSVIDDLETADNKRARFLRAQLGYLHRRSVILDVAVVLAAAGGAATCAAVLTLFVGAVRDATVASILFVLFGAAVVCALGAIVAYTVEMLLAGTGIRAEAAESSRSAGRGETVETAEVDPHSDEPETATTTAGE